MSRDSLADVDRLIGSSLAVPSQRRELAGTFVGQENGCADSRSNFEQRFQHLLLERLDAANRIHRTAEVGQGVQLAHAARSGRKVGELFWRLQIKGVLFSKHDGWAARPGLIQL